MPSIKCPVTISCPGSDDPISNYSSEAPDVINFGAIGFPIFNPDNPLGDDPRDPLNPFYTAAGCLSLCFSTVSQEAADDCAAADAYLCESGGRNPPPLNPVFYNDQQVCGFPCPDGTLFIWTVLAGTVVTGNQDLSNRIAAEIACQRAASRRLCLPTLSGGCLNKPFSQTITVTTGVPPLVYTITAGALPPGVTMTQDGVRTAILSGTPTAAGTFPFTLTVTDPAGNYFSKVYHFEVMGISPATLPQASAGLAYSQALAVVGGVPPYTFILELGTLPAGLTLSDAGVISGTPTETGTFNVTVSVSDSGTAFCTQDLTITSVIPGYQICSWTGVLAELTVPASWPASAFPAWDGKFGLKTEWDFGSGLEPIWYFLGKSIGGKKVSPDDDAFYPGVGWQAILCYSQLSYDIPTGVWFLEFQTPNCANIDFVLYTMTNHDPNNAAGVYTKSLVSGTADGPNSITVQVTGSTAPCCSTSADWVNAPGNCRLRISGYVDTLFGACAACNSGAIYPVWDGVFPNFLGFGSYTIDFGPGITRSVHGKQSPFLHIDWDPFGMVWNLTVQCQTGGGPIAQWFGQSAGKDPVGVYTQTSGCPGGPATVTVEGYSL